MKIKIFIKNKHKLHPGCNPAVDIAVFKKINEEYNILLIKRGKNSYYESGKLALPGGFHDTNQPINKPWKEDRETAKQAAIRELFEETRLDIKKISNLVTYIKEYEGVVETINNNSWVITKLFTIILPDNIPHNVEGSDDAESADWFNIKDIIGKNLAFDHNKKILDSIQALNLG